MGRERAFGPHSNMHPRPRTANPAWEAMRAERDRLREALEWIVNAADRDAYEFANLAFERARSALSPESSPEGR